MQARWDFDQFIAAIGTAAASRDDTNSHHPTVQPQDCSRPTVIPPGLHGLDGWEGEDESLAPVTMAKHVLVPLSRWGVPGEPPGALPRPYTTPAGCGGHDGPGMCRGGVGVACDSLIAAIPPRLAQSPEHGGANSGGASCV